MTADPSLYIEAMEHRDGAAQHGRALFSTEGFAWLRIGLANEDADTIQRGADIAYAWQDGGFPELGAAILADYQAWKSERRPTYQPHRNGSQYYLDDGEE